MDFQGDASSQRLNEEHVTATVVAYSGIIVVLLPLFHFALRAVPGVPPDSMPLRLGAAAISALVGLGLLLVPPLRRYANALQFVNILPALLVIAIVVVDSDNNEFYIVSELLCAIAAQQAFHRIRDLAATMAIGWAFQAFYSALHGVFFDPANIAALATYGGGYAVAFAGAALRIRTQRNELRSRLDAQRMKDRLADVHAMTRLGNWEHDLRTGRVDWSPELLRIFGLAPGRHALQGLYERSIHPQDAERVAREVALSRKTAATFDVDHRAVLPDGTIRWLHLRGKHEYDVDGTAVGHVAVVLDITDRKEAEENMLRLARVDPLTGLPNRETLELTLRDTLKRAQSAGQRCAVIFLDLDRFKDVNDTLGHALGDALLRAFAARLSMMLPPGASLARWGGDEFVVTLPSIRDDDEAAEVARILIRTTAEPFFVDEYELVVTISAGIAIYPSHGSDAALLVRNADIAMYRAKERELRYAFFEAEMHAAVTMRHRIQNELRKATASDHLVVHYQPIAEMSTARVVGAEALLRWRQADGTLLQPDDFIPIAEETGLIVPIGTWVLHHVCRQIKRWHDAGIDLVISVNISARQFAHPEFVDVLHMVLRQTGIDPVLLDIEITETALMSNVDPVRRIMADIEAMGVRVTIDDFGTGYSSFAYLKRFPLNSLKLDRALVGEVEGSGDRAILRSIVTIAHTLGMSVTAEGVETRSQFDVLDEARCDQVQGFYISQPLATDEFEAFYERVRGEPVVEPPRRPAQRVADITDRVPLRRAWS